MALRSPPSFYKILLDPSAPHLPLPANFVSKHLENKIPENPILRSANGRFSWKLKIKRIDGDYCFTDGWNNVVNDNQLGFGDFLVFRLVYQSTFKVSVYSPSGCEKYFISKTQVEYVEDVVDVDDDDDDDDDVEVVYEYEDGDGDDDDDDDDDEDYEKEDGEGDDDGSYIDGDDGDPFFMTIIAKTHKTLLLLPSEFMELAGIGAERRMTLKNPDGKEWQLALRTEKCNRSERYYLSSGWNEFRRGNELCEGDECVFKFNRSEGKLCLVKVTRKKAVARQPADKVEVVKRKRGRPPGERGGYLEVVKRSPKSKYVASPETEVVKRKRGRPPKSKCGVIPATAVVKWKRGGPPQEHGVCVEVVKRPRGRPPKSKSCVA